MAPWHRERDADRVATADRHRDGRKAGQVRRDGEDVGGVLFDRLVETRRGAERRGVHKDIDVAEARIVCLTQRLPKP